MNKINFFRKSKTKQLLLQKNLGNSLLRGLVLVCFWLLSICSVRSQTAPNISYATPQNYLLNAAITPLAPANLGGTVPAVNYSKTSAFAGSGNDGNTNGVNPLLAEFDAPLGMVQDGNGNIYFSDQNNHRIKKIDGVSGAVTQIAGATTPTPFLASASGSNDGTGVGNARFDSPAGIDYDGTGALYVADWGNNKIRKIVIASGAVTTVAGGGTGSQSGYTNATGSAARFLSPTDVKYRLESSVPYLYVTDAGNHCIRKINLNTNEVTTHAGTNSSGIIEGNLTTARFKNPTSMVFSSTGVLYVVDRGNNKIRKIDSGTVSTLSGSGTNATTEGNGATAAFADPYGITIDGEGNLYVTQALSGSNPSANFGFSTTNASNNYIRKINPSGDVTNFAGTGTRGAADNASRLQATFGSPAHLVFDSSRNILYVSEWYNDKIRKIELGGYSVAPALPAGISFDVTTGIFSGTPNAINNGPKNYTITAYNYYGSNTATVAIATGTLPVIASTTAVTAITSSSATTGGNVTATGGSALLEKGICWSTSANPTISNTKMVNESTAIGFYTSTISGLSAGATYYVRAYATNALGTAYGTQVSFTTLGFKPEISYRTPNIFIVNKAINALQVNNIGGAVPAVPGAYSVLPTLPNGLILNTMDGTISGTPTVLSTFTRYVVRANNPSGINETDLYIEIISPIPTWTGTEWIDGPARADYRAIIAGNYTSSANLEVGELIIKNNADVVFQSGQYLTINGKLVVEPGSTLMFENNANLVQTYGYSVNSGNISIKSNTTPLKRMDSLLWSSPVERQILKQFSPATLSERFSTFSHTQIYENVPGIITYNPVSSPDTTPFTKGQGYLIRTPDNHPNTPTIWTGTFTGIPNTGEIWVPAQPKFTAVGNPYPCTISSDAFIATNRFPTLYFWSNTDDPSGRSSSFVARTVAGRVSSKAFNSTTDENSPDGIIQVGQGFITSTRYLAYPNLIFDNYMKIGNNGTQITPSSNTPTNYPLRTKNIRIEKNRIWLNLTNSSGFFSQTLVAYMDYASSEIDITDGPYFNDSQTALTSIIDNEEFSIQGRSLPFDENDVVPLGFKTEIAGEFSLAIDHTDGLFADGQKVFVKDNLTNTIYDLSAGTYKFTTEAGVFNSRFALVYQNTLGIDNADALANQVLAYKQNDKIRIDAGSIIMAGVQVYDLNGRLLFERRNINTNQFVFSIAAAANVLLIKMTSNDGQTIVKKIVN